MRRAVTKWATACVLKGVIMEPGKEGQARNYYTWKVEEALELTSLIEIIRDYMRSLSQTTASSTSLFIIDI